MAENNSIRPIILILCLLLLSIGTQAQNQKDTIILNSAEVESFFLPAESHAVQDLEPMEALQAGALTVGDALQSKTAIPINSYGNSGVQAISFRGTGANHTQLYWNGFAVNSPTLGQADLSIFPSGGMSSLQIHSGLASLIDGSGGLGGSIQMQNDLSFNKGLNGFMSAQLASFHNYSGITNLSWSDGKISTYTSLSYQNSLNNFEYLNPDTNEERIFTNDNAEFTKTNVIQGLGFKINKKNTLKAFLWWNENNRLIPPSITNEYGVSDTLFDSALRTSIAWKHIRDKSTHEIIAAYFDDRQEFNTNRSYLYHFKNSHFAYRNVTYLPKDIRLKASLAYHNHQIESGGFAGDVTQEKLDVMLNLRIPFGKKLEADFIYRYEMIDSTLAPLMPMFALIYKPNTKLSIKASLARSYRHPSLNDLYWNPGGNPDLKSEEGWSGEIGIKWIRNNPKPSARFSSELELNYFSSSIDNWILWTPKENYWSPENIYHVKNSGIEFHYHIKYRLTRKLLSSINLRYSYTDTKNTQSDNPSDVSINKQLLYVPFHVANTSLKLEYKKFGIEYHYYFVSNRFMHRDHKAWMPYYMLSDVSAFAKIGESLNIHISVKNLLDKDYQVMPHRPMPGRNYSLRITYHFKKTKS